MGSSEREADVLECSKEGSSTEGSTPSEKRANLAKWFDRETAAEPWNWKKDDADAEPPVVQEMETSVEGGVSP